MNNWVHQDQLSANAIRVLESRYLKRDEQGLLETPQEMFQRVAHAVSLAELTWGGKDDLNFWEDRFFGMMNQLQFLPNSPTLMNAGTPSKQLSACFVLPVEDSLKDIFSSLKLAALIQQSGGGTGFNFSSLRPRNAPLHSKQGTSSGPVSFMKVFDAATEHIKQGGKRRGANMGILNVNHPDVEEFIESKSSEGNLRNFNISVGVSDAFMNAVAFDENWDLIDPNTHAVTKTICAKTLWNQIVEGAWISGDPGLIFLDTINKSNPTPTVGKIEATNPCGEVPLLPYESCNLGSINLSRFVIPDGSTKSKLNWEAIEQIIPIAIRFLDNVIEVNHYLSDEIGEITFANRKVGLGIMGWAEALCMLEIPYDSDDAVQLAEQLMKFISEKSLESSIILAKQRGAFRNWNKSIYYPNVAVRNATRTSIAPTGSISIIADTSSSIEPFFALAYQRYHVLENEILKEFNKNLLNYLSAHHINTQGILTAISETGTLNDITSLSVQEKSLFRTALEINPEWHLKHQAAFQKFTDNAVSKTINLPQDATIVDVSSIYEKAWKLNLKGITIFRSNSKLMQVLHPGINRGVKNCKVCRE